MKRDLPIVLLLVGFVAVYIFVLLETPTNDVLLQKTFSGASVVPGQDAPSVVDQVLERQELGRIATAYLREKGVEGEFRLRLERWESDWALVGVLFLEQMDQQQVLLKKRDGRWMGVAVGPDLSAWEPLVPEIFDPTDAATGSGA